MLASSGQFLVEVEEQGRTKYRFSAIVSFAVVIDK